MVFFQGLAKRRLGQQGAKRRLDRLGRGGDHTPFQWEGFAAVRISTPNEIYANQHRATDTLANMSVPYTAKVAKVNLVAAASLALGPKPPIVLPLVTVAAGIGGALFSRTTVDFKSDGPLFGADLPPKTYGPPVASAPCAWKTSWPDQAQLC